MSVSWWDRFSVLFDLYYITKAATIPTLKTLLQQPSLLLRPKDVNNLFFENVWNFMGDGVDEGGRETKKELLPKARGVVLEIGAGHGHSVSYLDLSKVTKYVALEPNIFMHGKLVAAATRAGFSQDQIQIIGCGAEDTSKILEALDGQQVDTLISILSLCGIPDTERVLGALVKDVLRPGGVFMFYEHVRCDPSPTLIWWQTFWTPLWQFFLGCRLDKPTHIYAERNDLWESRQLTGKLPAENPGLFWHRVGYYVKRSKI